MRAEGMMVDIRHGSLFTDNAADGIEPEKK